MTAGGRADLEKGRWRKCTDFFRSMASYVSITRWDVQGIFGLEISVRTSASLICRINTPLRLAVHFGVVSSCLCQPVLWRALENYCF